MTTLYPNPRLAALPCELMRGCTFAEDFVTETRVALNMGALVGTGNTVDHAIETDGNGYVSFTECPLQDDLISVVIRFSATALASTAAILLSNSGASLIADSNADGICIWVDATGVKANHGNGAIVPTKCSVALDYSDGEEHCLTYVINMTAGTHSLYVDALAVNTQATTINEEIGASTLLVAGSATNKFTGTIERVRVFEQALTEDEHDLYYADTLTSFLDMPTAVYRCDSFGNDTDSNTIHDRTTNHNDLYKGDRATSAGFPTFEDDKYLFDLVDDYISNFVTLPTGYTITAVSSTPQIPQPTIQQHNDTTFSLPLTVAGQYWGYLHSLIVHSKQLTQIELYHDEYQHQYWQWHGRLWGAYQRLFTEGVCKLAVFMDADYWTFRDYAGDSQGIVNGVTRGGADGCTFAAAGNVTLPHQASQNMAEGTIVLFGDFSGAHADETWIDKGENYKLRCTSGGNVIFGDGTESIYMKGGSDWGTHQHLAVTFKDGFAAQFFIDGKYASDGLSACVIDDTDTDDLIIGNNNGLTDNSERALMQVAIFNRVLTPREIKALYESAMVIGATAMETGNRTRVREVDTGTAIEETVDPGGPFQLIDITVIFNTAPTSSEDIVITSVNSDSDVVEEHRFDPSTSALTSHVFRFDKRFPDGTTLAVAYTNTDARTIQTNTVYQLDDSVV